MNFVLKIVGTKGSARVYHDTALGEYVVLLRDVLDALVPNAHYYTSSKDDAIGTAEFMVQ